MLQQIILQQFRSFAAHSVSENFQRRNKLLKVSKLHALTLYNFYWATTTIKGRLLSSPPMLKPFSGESYTVPSKRGPEMAYFGEMGV